jgi:nitroimidazol reductase NimA-like FMN-containing flavoprotein (pyridoxamine 5'-phosphate oxidase superfamily)
MTDVRLPVFHELSDAECRALMARHHFGRLAFHSGARVDIQPVGYVLEGDWLFMRSAFGAKFAALEHNPYVAFEVDEVRGPFDWSSVVAHGTIYELPSTGTQADRSTFANAVAALRGVMPEAFTAGDPVPERTIVYGLRVDRMSGRMADGDDVKRVPLPPGSRSRRLGRSDGS